MNSGVYAIAAPSGKRYVGSAVNFAARWRVHRCLLRQGNHHNIHLQRTADKVGVDALVFSVLVICSNENLTLYEQIATDAINPEFNVLKIARSSLGYKHTDETKEKSKDRRIGVKTDASKESFRQKLKGKKLSPENYARLLERAAKRRGVPVSNDQKEQIRATLKAKSQTPEMLAKYQQGWEKRMANRD